MWAGQGKEQGAGLGDAVDACSMSSLACLAPFGAQLARALLHVGVDRDWCRSRANDKQNK